MRYINKAFVTGVIFAFGCVCLVAGCTHLLFFAAPKSSILVYKDEYIIQAKGDFCDWAPGKPCDPTVLSAGEYSYYVMGDKHSELKLIRKVENGVVNTSTVGSVVVPYDASKDFCNSPEASGLNCDPNYVLSASVIPNDPLYSKLWGMERIRLKGALNKATGAGAYVFVIDTGIAAHDDLSPNLDLNLSFNAVTNKVGEAPDENGHGTHVAGTIAAVLNNNRGVTGVSPGAKVVGIKFLRADGSGSLYDAIKGLDYVTNVCRTRNIKVCITNNSWGGGGYSKALYDAIMRLHAVNGLFIAAAGNEGDNNDLSPHYPSTYDISNIIAVAAIGPDGKLAYFSNYGRTTVDVAAPGVGILSTSHIGNNYVQLSGSSMATPHVSGIAALLASRGFDRDTVRARILNGSVKTKALKGKLTTEGETKARKAVRD